MIFDFFYSILKNYKFKFLIWFLTYYFIAKISEVIILPCILKTLGNNYSLETLTTSKVIFLSVLYTLFFCINNIIRILSWKKINFDLFVKAESDVRRKLLDYTLQHSLGYFYNNMSGFITNKVSECTAVFCKIIDNFSIVFWNFLIILISTFFYIKIDYILSIFLISWIILFLLFQFKFSKFIYNARKEISEQQNKMSGILNDDISNIINIKTFSTYKSEENLIKKQGIKILSKKSKSYKIQTWYRIAIFIFMMILMCFMIGYSGYLIYNNKILIGTFLFVSQNIILITFTTNRTFQASIELISNYATMKNCLETIFTPIEIVDNTDNVLKVQNGKIEFKNVTFKY